MSKKHQHWPKGHASGDSVAAAQGILDNLRSFFAKRGAGSVRLLHLNLDTKQKKPLATVGHKKLFDRYHDAIDMGIGRNGERWRGVSLHGFNIRWDAGAAETSIAMAGNRLIDADRLEPVELRTRAMIDMTPIERRLIEDCGLGDFIELLVEQRRGLAIDPRDRWPLANTRRGSHNLASNTSVNITLPVEALDRALGELHGWPFPAASKIKINTAQEQ